MEAFMKNFRVLVSLDYFFSLKCTIFFLCYVHQEVQYPAVTKVGINDKKMKNTILGNKYSILKVDVTSSHSEH